MVGCSEKARDNHAVGTVRRNGCRNMPCLSSGKVTVNRSSNQRFPKALQRSRALHFIFG